MAKLSDLLKFKKSIIVIDPLTNEELATAWVRVIGDDDLKEAYRFARIESAARRAALRDKNSPEYRDEISQLNEIPRESLYEIIASSREADYVAEASLMIERPDIPEITEVSTRPDAPSLEDQERLDALIAEQTAEYNTKILDYLDTKRAELKAQLDGLSTEEVFALTGSQIANVEAMEVFVSELNDQKAFRGTYDDEACTKRSFETVEEFKGTHTQIKQQIIDAYRSLEISDDELKN